MNWWPGKRKARTQAKWAAPTQSPYERAIIPLCLAVIAVSIYWWGWLGILAGVIIIFVLTWALTGIFSLLKLNHDPIFQERYFLVLSLPPDLACVTLVKWMAEQGYHQVEGSPERGLALGPRDTVRSYRLYPFGEGRTAISELLGPPLSGQIDIDFREDLHSFSRSAGVELYSIYDEEHSYVRYETYLPGKSPMRVDEDTHGPGYEFERDGKVVEHHAWGAPAKPLPFSGIPEMLEAIHFPLELYEKGVRGRVPQESMNEIWFERLKRN